ncbi:MAG: hypothetical protein LBD11_04380 [Candidatus Peribacteria bacterium]|jgi:hypothetical protein|nr:hypothetical protein [Candidatus Peribacteria bacterium]
MAKEEMEVLYLQLCGREFDRISLRVRNSLMKKKEEYHSGFPISNIEIDNSIKFQNFSLLEKELKKLKLTTDFQACVVFGTEACFDGRKGHNGGKGYYGKKPRLLEMLKKLFPEWEDSNIIFFYEDPHEGPQENSDRIGYEIIDPLHLVLKKWELQEVAV